MKRTIPLIFLITAIILILAVLFFTYTTKLSSPVTMNLHLNEPKGDNSDTIYQNTETKLTLVLLGNDLIFGYKGNNISGGKRYLYSIIRSLIAEESKKYSPDEFVVIIKPTKESSYKNTVDVLDEMIINNIKKYAMRDITKEEQKFVMMNRKITEP